MFDMFIGGYALLDALSALALKVATVDRCMDAAGLRIARINRAWVAVIAIDQRMHAPEFRVARVDRTHIPVVTVDRFEDTTHHRIAVLRRAGVIIVTDDRFVNATQHGITRIDGAYVAIITIDRGVEAFSGVVIACAGQAGIGIVTGRFALSVDTLLAGGALGAASAAVVVISVEIDTLIRAERPTRVV